MQKGFALQGRFIFRLWGGLQNWSRGGFGFGFGVGFDSRVGVDFDSAWIGLQFGRRDWFLIPALGWAYNLKYFGFGLIAVGL